RVRTAKRDEYRTRPSGDAPRLPPRWRAVRARVLATDASGLKFDLPFVLSVRLAKNWPVCCSQPTIGLRIPSRIRERVSFGRSARPTDAELRRYRRAIGPTDARRCHAL